MDEDFLATRLTQLRIQRGVSAREMSLSLGQAPNYINTIENRKSLPSMQAFFFICEYLNITPQEFFDTGNPCPEEIRAFISEAQQLDPQSRALVLELMQRLRGAK